MNKWVEVKTISTNRDLKKAFQIRIKVFVEEQGVPLEDEIDEFDNLELDEKCEHILVYYRGEPVGTGRIRFVADYAKLERICVVLSHRKLGIGKIIIEALEKVAEHKGISLIHLHGQEHAEDFYIKLGYQTSSNLFMEDGIPHFLMQKKLK